MRQVIRCPRCGAQLDLGEYGTYEIILATGVVCNHCHARLVIEHNIARQETGGSKVRRTE
jgi:DNA-directed RNA polymerase subunit RPC12/RpoP